MLLDTRARQSVARARDHITRVRFLILDAADDADFQTSGSSAKLTGDAPEFLGSGRNLDDMTDRYAVLVGDNAAEMRDAVCSV